MLFKTITFALAVAVTLPVVAQTTDSAAPLPKKEKKICRRYAVTGSMFGMQAECHTAAEWSAIDRKNSQNTNDSFNSLRPATAPRGN